MSDPTPRTPDDARPGARIGTVVYWTCSGRPAAGRRGSRTIRRRPIAWRHDRYPAKRPRVVGRRAKRSPAPVSRSRLVELQAGYRSPRRRALTPSLRKLKGADHATRTSSASRYRRRSLLRPRDAEALRLVRRLRTRRHGQFFESLGLRPGRRHAVAAGVTETSGSILIALGLATPAAAAGLTAVMITALSPVGCAVRSPRWVPERRARPLRSRRDAGSRRHRSSSRRRRRPRPRPPVRSRIRAARPGEARSILPPQHYPPHSRPQRGCAPSLTRSQAPGLRGVRTADHRSRPRAYVGFAFHATQRCESAVLTPLLLAQRSSGGSSGGRWRYSWASGAPGVQSRLRGWNFALLTRRRRRGPNPDRRRLTAPAAGAAGAEGFTDCCASRARRRGLAVEVELGLELLDLRPHLFAVLPVARLAELLARLLLGLALDLLGRGD